MGAQVSKTFTKQVTHVIFNNGHPATWRKAKESGVRLVSVLWVGRCYDDRAHVDEDLFPALDEKNPLLKNKKHRCMQPKDSPERTPENDRRMRRKLDKMMKDLIPRQPLITDVSPIIIDEENGIVYSPALKRSDYMAQRLKDMKEKHENLSPTANCCQRSERRILPPLPVERDIHIPFELDSVSKKRKQRRSEVTGSESSSKKKKVEESKTGKSHNQQSDAGTEKQHIVCQLIKTLGGFSIVDQVCESTTHVVSGGHRRTLNILLGIARGCWILSFEWILWCLEQRQWIPEEPYELSDQFPAAQICRLQRHLSAGEHQQDLFRGQPAMFVTQHSQPPTQSLVELIELCGGTVCKTVRQAGICIGKYSGRRPVGTRILSEQWVLDSITHLKQMSYENYNLE
uniref:BRCT domain-containing protein n=1 Tax=Mola mola TaxID=94237 RepID=A0A3Q4BAK1_MOLML